MDTSHSQFGTKESLHTLVNYVLMSLFAAVMLVSGVRAGDLSFAWDAVDYSGGTVVYEVHYGEASRGYNGHVAATNTSATVAELQGDHTYYFAVRACTEERNLCSGFSNELSSTIPGAPVVNFTANKVNGEAPLKVTLTASISGSISELNWHFGDAASSTDFGGPENSTTSFTYNKAGTYDVMLIAQGPGGKTVKFKGGYIKVTKSATDDNGSDDSSNPGLAEDDGYLSDVRDNNDLVVDFGKDMGLWMRLNNTDWRKLNHYSPDSIVVADLDGDGLDEVIMDFAEWPGLFAWGSTTGYRQLHANSAEILTAGDLDNNGLEDLIIDFGEGPGAWVYLNDSRWVHVSAISPSTIIALDKDGDGADEMVAGFGEHFSKTWARTLSTPWTPIYAHTPLALAKADMDGNGQEELVGDFGKAQGTWFLLNNQEWRILHAFPFEHVAAVDTDGDGDEEILMSFGSKMKGLFSLDLEAGWSLQHSFSPRTLAPSDLDRDGIGDLIVDFGSQYGAWSYEVGSDWRRVHTMSAKQVHSANIDGL